MSSQHLCSLQAPAHQLQPAGSGEQAVQQAGDTRVLAGIGKALLPYGEPLPSFPAAPGKAVGTADFREPVSHCNTKWKCCSRLACLQGQARKHGCGKKSLLSCRADAVPATGVTQSSTCGGFQALETLLPCWGTGAGPAQSLEGRKCHQLGCPKPQQCCCGIPA